VEEVRGDEALGEERRGKAPPRERKPGGTNGKTSVVRATAAVDAPARPWRAGPQRRRDRKEEERQRADEVPGADGEAAVPVRIAGVGQEDGGRGEEEGDEGASGESLPGRDEPGRDEEEKRAEDEEPLRRVEEEAEEDRRVRQADAEEPAARELAERRVLLQPRRKAERAAEAGGVVGAEERREREAAEDEGAEPPRRAPGRDGRERDGGDGRRVLGEDREAEEGPCREIAPEARFFRRRSEQSRPGAEEAGGDEGVREEEERVGEERRGEDGGRRASPSAPSPARGVRTGGRGGEPGASLRRGASP
jgi:hypothetical protein